MEELNKELQELEKIENREEQELKEFLEKLAQNGKQSKVQEVYADVEKFISLNRKIVKLTELLSDSPEDFIDIYRRLESLKRKHEELEQNLIHELEELGVPDRYLEKLHSTDRKLEKIDKEVLEDVKERRSEHAESILNDRPTIYFEAQALEKFVSAVKEEQLGNGAEVPGVFGFEKRGNGYYLKKFLVLENTDPNYGSFNLNQQVKYAIETYGNDRNIIIAHSHPIGDFSHSGSDKDIISKANGIGVIGVPHEGEIYPVPEILEEGRWVNLPSEVVEKGEKISENRLKNSFPAVDQYNQALKEAIIEGEEHSWPSILPK